MKQEISKWEREKITNAIEKAKADNEFLEYQSKTIKLGLDGGYEASYKQQILKHKEELKQNMASIDFNNKQIKQNKKLLDSGEKEVEKNLKR